MEDIKVEVACLRRLDGNGALKAFADVVIGDSFLVKGMRIVEGRKGLFVSMPRELGKDGKWYDNVLPVTREAREVLVEAMMRAYQG